MQDLPRIIKDLALWVNSDERVLLVIGCAFLRKHGTRAMGAAGLGACFSSCSLWLRAPRISLRLGPILLARSTSSDKHAVLRMLFLGQSCVFPPLRNSGTAWALAALTSPALLPSLTGQLKSQAMRRKRNFFSVATSGRRPKALPKAVVGVLT